MKLFYSLLIFFYNLFLFPFSKEDMDIFNNPTKVGNNSNPINYRIIIEDKDKNGTINILKYQNSYLFTQSFFFMC